MFPNRIAIAVLLALVSASCRGTVHNTEAIRQGVIDYLSKRSDMMVASMDIDVTSVSFRENEADAVVAFRPKGSTSAGMNMSYTLERKGAQWVVKSKKEAGAGAHASGESSGGGGGGQMPPGHPPVPVPDPGGRK